MVCDLRPNCAKRRVCRILQIQISLCVPHRRPIHAVSFSLRIGYFSSGQLTCIVPLFTYGKQGAVRMWGWHFLLRKGFGENRLIGKGRSRHWLYFGYESMDLLLHTPNDQSDLAHHYKRAFENAAELFIVTAYLTDWDDKLKLQPSCSSFRIIIGKDFGITRKAACEKVMRWLPSKRKGQFMVADGIAGFHPKAIFWKEKDGRCFSIVGSSNLTRAAFETNYEANLYQHPDLEHIRTALNVARAKPDQETRIN